jgi:hypothetical protein
VRAAKLQLRVAETGAPLIGRESIAGRTSPAAQSLGGGRETLVGITFVLEFVGFLTAKPGGNVKINAELLAGTLQGLRVADYFPEVLRLVGVTIK